MEVEIEKNLQKLNLIFVANDFLKKITLNIHKDNVAEILRKMFPISFIIFFY